MFEFKCVGANGQIERYVAIKNKVIVPERALLDPLWTLAAKL